MSTLNYIIATYAGTRTEYALEVQLQQLLTLILIGKLSCLKQVTVMCPPTIKPQHTAKKYYYDKEKWIAIYAVTSVDIVFTDYVGDNVHASYDQWIQGYLHYPDFDYYLFIEDDYFIHPSLHTFDQDLINVYNSLLQEGNTDVGYACSLANASNGHHYHAAISNGIVNKKSMQMLGSDVLDKYYICAKNYPIEQVAFSDMFIENGVPVYSLDKIYIALFWSSYRKRLENYSLSDADKYLFVPLQALTIGSFGSFGSFGG